MTDIQSALRNLVSVASREYCEPRCIGFRAEVADCRKLGDDCLCRQPINRLSIAIANADKALDESELQGE